MEEKERARAKVYYEALQLLVRCVLVMMLLFTFVFRLSVVRGHSMLPSLQDQDLLLMVSKPLCGEFQPGDIVVLQKTSLQVNQIIKRVIATEGQVVDIDFTTGAVFVDGQRLQEDYINEPAYRQEGMEFPLRVPEGSVFVMGDNRNHSTDSRDPRLGTVDVRYIVGKAALLLFPGADSDSGQRQFGRMGGLG